MHLNSPIVGITATADGVLLDGRSTVACVRIRQRASGAFVAWRISTRRSWGSQDRSTGGYWMVAPDGGVSGRSTLLLGSAGGAIPAPVTGMSAVPERSGLSNRDGRRSRVRLRTARRTPAGARYRLRRSWESRSPATASATGRSGRTAGSSALETCGLLRRGERPAQRLIVGISAST